MKAAYIQFDATHDKNENLRGIEKYQCIIVFGLEENKKYDM